VRWETRIRAEHFRVSGNEINQTPVDNYPIGDTIALYSTVYAGKCRMMAYPGNLTRSSKRPYSAILPCLILCLVLWPFTAVPESPPFTTASPLGGICGISQSVSLTPDREAAVFYTADGSLPTTGSPVYEGPIPVTGTTTLRFFARDTSGNEEPVRTETYRIVRSAFVGSKGGYGHMLALWSDHTLWTWGWNGLGQLGTGTSEATSVPALIPGHGWVALSGGSFHSLAVRSDHTLWAWGDNAHGQLGDGTSIPHSSPVQVGSNAAWTGVAAGSLHSLALKGDGSLWAWGSNASGQLGDSTTVDRSSPVQVGTDMDWAAIAAGSSHSLALKQAGSLWTWGLNTSGQLGDGSTSDKPTPVQIGTDATWSFITAGSTHSLALRKDGSLWVWGANTYGQLGDNSTTDRNSPVQIPGTWIAVAAGDYNTAGIKADGSLWIWGLNRWGGVDCSPGLIPIRVGTDTDWIAISSGSLTFAALKADGSLWTWGQGGFSQLGDGTTTDRCTPGQVPAPPSAMDGGHILLSPGWNFVSPGLQSADPIDDLLRDIAPNIKIIWGYDNTAKLWKKWVPGGESNTLTALDAGKGYWIYADDESQLAVTGLPPGPVTLSPGWNLVGHRGTDGATVTTGLADLTGTWDLLWTWENGTWMLEWTISGTFPFPEVPGLYRGRAYWLRVKPGLAPFPWN
jgi:alpha-tubulin suppressor-like RCC1 family protein